MPSKTVDGQASLTEQMLKEYRIPQESTVHLITDGAQDIVFFAIERIRKAVVSTMGPNGKLAIIKDGTAIKTTKDGVTGQVHPVR